MLVEERFGEFHARKGESGIQDANIECFVTNYKL